MNTLLLQIFGPLQAFGDEFSQFGTRKTNLHPTKSFGVGLIATVMGRSRRDPIEDLSRLPMGVRIEADGAHILEDFHAVENVPQADGGMDRKNPFKITRRSYLTDASFLFGIESDDVEMLVRIENALINPVRTPYIGRKCCPFSIPPVLPDGGIREGLDLFDALRNEPPLNIIGGNQSMMEVVIEMVPGREWAQPPMLVHDIRDVPIFFDPRQFRKRKIGRMMVDTKVGDDA